MGRIGAQKYAFIILALITRCDPIYLGRRQSFCAQRDILSAARRRCSPSDRLVDGGIDVRVLLFGFGM